MQLPFLPSTSPMYLVFPQIHESIGHFLLNCAKETWPNVFNMILMHAQETRLIFRNHICMLRHTHKRILELFVNCVHSWLLEVTSVGIAGSSGKRGQIPKVVKFMALLQYSSTVLISLRFMYFLILVYGVYCLSRYEAWEEHCFLSVLVGNF